ncbi:MAG: PQQ-dependent catabolism-associated CXXCW motif protein [Alphaproteobacteria bacterium]|nr:PQQ-dependent catabolism-associated CXXCW motif protein [Alphaproteobacteria bacterium]
MMLRPASLFLAAVITAICGASAAELPSEPDGYRMQDYHAPVPATLTGARVLTTSQAAALWREKRAVFVDVLPRAPKPQRLPEGTVWRDPPRRDIPGSIWLPDTGYGSLAPGTEAYFRRALEAITHGERGRGLVFYCEAGCWMSWNAAKRALGYGYVNVAWFPDGSDGWEKAGLKLEQSEPLPRRENER